MGGRDHSCECCGRGGMNDVEEDQTTPEPSSGYSLARAADLALEALRLVHDEIEWRARENDEINIGQYANQLRSVVNGLGTLSRNVEEAA